VYFSRTASYVGMVNTAMILFLLLSNLEKYNIDIDIQRWMIPIMILWVGFMILFGVIEEKLGFYGQEKSTLESKSPSWTKLFNKLDKIEKRIDKLEKKK
jgi:hypothetical protein